MTDKLDDVWASRDYPVLREITSRLDQGDRSVLPHHLAAATGLPEEQVQLALSALERRHFIEGSHANDKIMSVREISATAYLITGLHPDGDDALSGLISALRQAADETNDEAERGRLRKAADALAVVGRDLGVGLMTAVISRYATGA